MYVFQSKKQTKYYFAYAPSIVNLGPEQKWKNTNITYSVHNYDRFPKDKVDGCLRRALNIWSEAAPRLRFRQTEDEAMVGVNIYIRTSPTQNENMYVATLIGICRY